MKKDNEKPLKVYCLPGVGEKFGSGHLKRMQTLVNVLRTKDIDAVLINSEDKVEPGYGVVVFDKRDESLGSLTDFIESGGAVISIDNRGKGRVQASAVYDTLPHPDMKEEENKQALSRFLLDPFFIQDHSASAKAVLHSVTGTEEALEKCKKEDVLKNKNGVSILIHRPGVQERNFQSKLKSSNIVITYFGQTLFEAIYCGKQIFLYSISDYHEKLGVWFVERWNNNPDWASSFDGKGYIRLQKFILELGKSKNKVTR